jgi:hypothetical protein
MKQPTSTEPHQQESELKRLRVGRVEGVLRRDGIVEMRLVGASHGSMGLAKDASQVGRKLLKGEGGLILCDCTGLKTSDAASRRFQPFGATQRLAFFVPDYVSRWIVKTFLAISRPSFKTRVFGNKVSAIDWLLD